MNLKIRIIELSVKKTSETPDNVSTLVSEVTTARLAVFLQAGAADSLSSIRDNNSVSHSHVVSAQ